MATRLPPVDIPIRGIDDFSKVANNISGKLGNMSKKLTSIGKKATIGLTLPIAAFGVSTLKTAGDFEYAMNRVGAVSRSNSVELEKMRDVAKELGKTTQFSAKEAADGMSFLAMAGFEANEIIASMPGVLDLAAAGQMDLAQAADVASNILTGYGLKASELTNVNDIMTATFTRTNTSLAQLGEAMKFVAPVASAMKVDISEASASIGLLGNAGIQASMAGTTLRAILSRLSDPANEAVEVLQRLGIRKDQVVDAEGNVSSIISIVKALEESGASAADMLTIFGDRAGPGMAALVKQGSSELSKLTDTLQKAAGKGGTTEIAAAQMKGFNGGMKELGSAFQALQIAIGDSGILEFASKFVRKLADLLRKMSEANPAFLRLGTILAGVAAAIGPILVMMGAMGMVFSKLVAIFGSKVFLSAMGFLSKGLAVGLKAALGPIGLIVAAVLIWSNVVRQIVKNWQTFVDTFTDFKLFAETMKIFLADIFGPVGKFLGIGGGLNTLDTESTARSVANNSTNRSVVDVNVKSDRPGVRAEVISGGANLMTELGIMPAG